MNGERTTRVAGTILLVLALLLIVWKANERGLSHDEHQFVSPGLLTVERGLLPYRDFALFHVPNLVLLHAAIAHFVEYKLLALRVFTALCIWLNVVLLARFAARQFGSEKPFTRLALATLATALFFFSPVFGYTARFIWNHGTPLMITFAAWLLLLDAASGIRSGLRLGASGFLLALAAGMRLTLAPLVASFALTVLMLFPERNWRSTTRGLASFAAGGIIGALPCLYFFFAAPEQFRFCNFESARYAQVWRELPFWHGDLSAAVDPEAGLLDSNYPALRGLPLEDKLMVFVRKSLAVHWPVHAAGLLLGLPGLVVVWRRGTLVRLPAASAWLCLPFIIWGCLAPSRFNRQYAYPLVFFLVLVTITGLAALIGERRARAWSVSVFGALALAALIIGAPDYRGFKGAHKVRRWSTVRTHHEALQIRAAMPGVRRVLTFDALLAQEAGFDVYPEFAAGQFPWRLAHLIPADKRARFHLVGPGEIAARLANDPPDAVLLGDDPQFEAPLAEFARARGFEHVDGKRSLWLTPSH